jgi:hypothetical protein
MDSGRVTALILHRAAATYWPDLIGAVRANSDAHEHRVCAGVGAPERPALSSRIAAIMHRAVMIKP